MTSEAKRDGKIGARLAAERLEPRDVPAVTAALAGGNLVLVGTGNDRIDVSTEAGQLVVADRGQVISRVPVGSVSTLSVNLAGGDNSLRVDNSVPTPTTVFTGPGRNRVRTGAGTTNLTGNTGEDVVTVGPGAANVTLVGGGPDIVYRLKPTDFGGVGAEDAVQRDAAPAPDPNQVDQEALQQTLRANEVEAVLRNAAAISPTNDAIIAVVDRNGRILGVRVEAGVAPEIQTDAAKLIFAIDGAVAKARTGAFFGSNGSPLTSRTIQYISQSTITQREVEANPNVLDPNSTDRGPGYVAAVGIRSHFPPNTPFTPQVDLFGIEHTNRDGSFLVGADDRLGTADDVLQLEGTRFNIPTTEMGGFAPGKRLFAPDSFGVDSDLLPGQPNRWQNRGIATLPGGVPIYRNGQLVGGIGVFFPGKTGFATEENSVLSTTFDKTKPDRSLEAELIAFAGAGGASPSEAQLKIGVPNFPINVPPATGEKDTPVFGFPAERFGDLRIDLVGIQLEVFGPGGLTEGLATLIRLARQINAGTGDPNSGRNIAVDGGADGLNGLFNPGNTTGDVMFRDGMPVSDGFIVRPMDGNGITAGEVTKIINDARAQADKTRAAIRLPVGARAKFVYAVADKDGKIVGLFRDADATIFSIDVAVAKARNANYYADATKLQAVDQVQGVDAGTAFTARTFRYLALPRFPEGIDTSGIRGPFSQLNDGGADPTTGLQVGARLPASAYQSVYGYDSFNPGTNFRDPTNQGNRNGIVFFPGSAPLYKNDALIGGFGVSGDGVDQDDVVTGDGVIEFGVPTTVKRADQAFVRGVRLPYQKFNRNPEG